MKIYDKYMYFLQFSAFFSEMWDTKRQIQFTKFRHNTINIKHTKFDVNVSEMQNPFDFCGRSQPWGENIQKPLLTLETF